MADKKDYSERSENRSPRAAGIYFGAHGRRKEATARVRLFKGKGEVIVNGKPAQDYFHGQAAQVVWQKPFLLTKTLETHFATINVSGSGKNSQLEAVVNGLAHALNNADAAFRPVLKKAGLLTRDPRVKERRKYGRAQKARKGKQSPKR